MNFQAGKGLVRVTARKSFPTVALTLTFFGLPCEPVFKTLYSSGKVHLCHFQGDLRLNIKIGPKSSDSTQARTATSSSPTSAEKSQTTHYLMSTAHSFTQTACELQVQEPIRYEKFRVNVNRISKDSGYKRNCAIQSINQVEYSIRSTLGQAR